MNRNDKLTVSQQQRSERESAEEQMETNVDSQNEDSIITLDESTITQIPRHVNKLLLSLEQSSKLHVIKALITAIGLESGFIGDWCFCDDSNSASWTSFIDRKVLENYAKLRTEASNDEVLRFKFILEPPIEISLHFLESGDLTIITGSINSPVNSLNSTRSLAILHNRYVVTKKLNSKNLPASFRNLQELSIKVKNQIFLPLRNEIFSESTCKSPYPSLHGIPDDCLINIFRFSTTKDVASLSRVCKNINQAAVQYLLRIKQKIK